MNILLTTVCIVFAYLLIASVWVELSGEVYSCWLFICCFVLLLFYLFLYIKYILVRQISI